MDFFNFFEFQGDLGSVVFMCEYNVFASNFLIKSNKYVDRKYLNSDRCFIKKKCKLSFEDTVYYPLLQEGHTNSREANDYIRMITGDIYAMLSQTAIGKKRAFIEPQLYIDMYLDYIDELYSQFNDELTWKGYNCYAGDTSVIRVPNVSKTKEAFPVHQHKPARARLSMFADVNHGFIVEAKLVEKKSSEAQLAINHVHNLKKRRPNEKSLVTYDRGYNSFDLIFNHLYLGVDFLIRLKDSTLSREIEKLTTSDDEIIKLYLNKEKTNKITNDKIRKKFEKERYITLRVTKVQITGKDGKQYTETLLSTLPMDKFSKKDMKQLYGLRWRIETEFERIKHILELENFTGQRRIIIEQDVYSKIFLLNLLLTIKKDADREIQEKHKNKDLKHEYQANANHLLGSLQPFLYMLINSESLKERQRITEHIMKLAKQRLVLKKDERKKDPKRHTGDIEADYKSNNRKA